MRSRVPLLVFLFTIGSFALPFVAHAQSIPFFGPIVPESASTCAIGWGALIVVINRIIALLITLAIVFVAPIMIAWAGFLFVINPVNAGGREKAKGILSNTIVGIVIALAGWLIVDAVMAVLYNPSAAGGTWSSIVSSGGLDYCLIQAASLQTLNQAPITGISAYGSYSPGGSCTAPVAGPCTTQNLQNSCFGSTANQAAIVCNRESSGNSANLSRSDVTADGYSYSIGLFQINITNSFNQQVDGQSCSSAFSQPCQNSGGYSNVQPSGLCSSKVVDQTLYRNCVAAAENPAGNITQACRLSNNGTNWSAWRNTAAACGL
jgi:hypothetical protein